MKITQIFSISILLLACLSCKKDNTAGSDSVSELKLLSQSTLPSSIEECSGVEITADKLIWLHNDGGNDPILYAVDENGIFDRTIQLINVENNDWEDLAQDETGNLYIGDFGNNDNDRTDLAIYRIPAPSGISSTIYTPEIINFVFEDQDNFPPVEADWFFDTEAFFVSYGKVYLFIKDRSTPFVGLTNLYAFPAEVGEQVAEKLGTFDTSTQKSEGAVTGADISADGTKVVLLSNEKVWLFTDFTAPDYFSGTVEELDIPNNHQYEGLVFADACTIWLTSERKNEGELQLESYGICD